MWVAPLQMDATAGLLGGKRAVNRRYEIGECCMFLSRAMNLNFFCFFRSWERWAFSSPRASWLEILHFCNFSVSFWILVRICSFLSLSDDCGDSCSSAWSCSAGFDSDGNI